MMPIPDTFPSGVKFEKLSHHQCLDKLLALMDYPQLRKEQETLRAKGIYRGIGLAAMIEVTNPSPAFYGVGGARISAQDGATIRLDPAGMVNVLVSVTEQGQGTEAIFTQIAATAVGVKVENVRVITGDMLSRLMVVARGHRAVLALVEKQFCKLARYCARTSWMLLRPF
jgi:carbon-monoxide dehydrogenase large subunit